MINLADLYDTNLPAGNVEFIQTLLAFGHDIVQNGSLIISLRKKARAIIHNKTTKLTYLL